MAKLSGPRPASVLITCSSFLLSALTAEAATNFDVPWSSNKFGPDGPWQAVSVTVGGTESGPANIRSQNVTDLALYPGGQYNSMTFASSACEGYEDTLCGQGGTWDVDTDQLEGQYIQWQPSWQEPVSKVSVFNTQLLTLGLTIEKTTVFNASISNAQLASSSNVTYPNGKVGGVPMGYLALGGEDNGRPDQYQFFTTDASENKGYSAWIFPGYLYNISSIPSYSFGLHIGSAAFNYPGSLVFGGYNKGRVIGPVTSFSNASSVDLLDVGIGVATGKTPFSFEKKDNLLSGGQTVATPDPLDPYIALPRQTCDNIVSELPVTYDNDLKYYLWNTSDPNYTKVVQSPAYLGFTFPPTPGGTDKVVIKVPFALLNLTLDKPITDTPKQYFPCMPFEGEPRLGRAFLQAAFLGRNWNTRTSWLAQAPGPGAARRGLGDSRTDIADGDTIIDGFSGSNLFTSSWAGQWSVEDSQNGGGANGGDGGNGGSGGGSSGLSTGAKAGIGVGAGIVGLALLALGVFFLGRSRRNKKENPYETANTEQPGQYHDHKPPADTYAHEAQPFQQQQQQQHQDWNHHQGPVELPLSQSQPQELAGSNPYHGPVR